MSYILDALRKSERDRRQSEAVSLGEFVPEPSTSPPRRMGALIAGGVAVVAVITLGAYWWGAHRTGSTVAVATLPAATEAAPAAVATQPVQPAPVAPTPPTLRPTAFAQSADTGARDLADEARTLEPSSRPAPVATVTRSTPIAVARSAPVASSPAADTVKFLRAMSPEFQKSLPELVVNIHIYSPAEAERILYINNQPYRAGQKIQDGLIVEDIVPDGVVISYRGQRFKLPRPS